MARNPLGSTPSISGSAFAKATELQQRLWFTLGALLVYRLGTYIPVPGIDPTALSDLFNDNSGGLLGMFNMMAGGALGRMTIFALSVFPYITASIITQLLTAVSPQLEALKKDGESGRKKINQYTRYLTVVLAIVQGYGFAVGLESAGAVTDPGLFFRITTVFTLLGGVMFLMWLGEQVTSRGIGNGISLIIFTGIVAELPRALAGTLELGRTGAISAILIVALLIMAIAVIAFIVFIERSQRRIQIQYPKRQMGNKLMGGESSHLPLKINMAGVIPPIFASSIILFPATLGGWFSQSEGMGWLADITSSISPGQPLYIMFYGAAIIFFTFFYTALTFNAKDTADNLRKSGGFIPGIRPGQHSADYIDAVTSRLTAVGAIYITAVCLLPEFLILYWNVPFYFGGTSLLIIVVVVMDFIAQAQSHMMSNQYEGLMRKANLK